MTDLEESLRIILDSGDEDLVSLVSALKRERDALWGIFASCVEIVSSVTDQDYDRARSHALSLKEKLESIRPTGPEVEMFGEEEDEDDE